MIEVTIRHVESDTELGRITIENVGDTSDLVYSDYSVRLGVERIDNVAIYRRAIYSFPRRKYNVLALLRQALGTLGSSELELDGNLDSQPEQSLLRKSLLERRFNK